ncbi:MAG: hypothetical protein AB7U76_24250 [Pirellulales bacterium]
MEGHEIALALGKLTEAVEGLRRDMQEFKFQRADLSRRTGFLERHAAWAKGAMAAIGAAVTALGVDRIAAFFHR